MTSALPWTISIAICRCSLISNTKHKFFWIDFYLTFFIFYILLYLFKWFLYSYNSVFIFLVCGKDHVFQISMFSLVFSFVTMLQLTNTFTVRTFNSTEVLFNVAFTLSFMFVLPWRNGFFALISGLDLLYVDVWCLFIAFLPKLFLLLITKST